MQIGLDVILICSFILVLCILNIMINNQIIMEVVRKKRSLLHHAMMNLPFMILTFVWVIVGFPLPLYYMGFFILKVIQICLLPMEKISKLILLNIPFCYRASLQMLFIGIGSLITYSSMNLLLSIFLYRALSVVVFVGAGMAADILILKKQGTKMFLDFAAASEETKSLMPLMWTLALFTLVDSILCFSDPVPVYSPLFLAGSNVMLLFFIYQLISNVYSNFRNSQIEERYRQMNRIEQQYEQKNQQLRSLLYTDPLTGIFSRRYVMEKMTEFKKEKVSFSLVFIDLDRLKLINDREGHNAGDRYLISFTEIFRSFLRAEDTFARIGGDEFLVLMPQCDITTVSRRMKEIREEMEDDERWNHPFSFSFGAAMADGETDDEELLKEADQAMYKDKQRLQSKF